MDPPTDHEGARRELVRGKLLVTQLRATLERSSSDRDAVDLLMEEISESFTRALEALNSNTDQARNIDATSQLLSPNSNTTNWSPSYRTRADSVKRTLSTKPFEDGYSWKKYGQKIISGSTNPRFYFKCVLRKDQGCIALKQVQQSETEPTKFHVTYIGQHTCTAHVEASSPPDKCFLSFGAASQPNNEQMQPWSNFGACNAAASLASDMVFSTSPNPSDADSKVFESGAGFYYEEN